MLLKVELGSIIPCEAHAGEPLIPLGNNPSLPEIIAMTFGWEMTRIEISDKSDVKMVVYGNRIGSKIVMLPHFSYGPFVTPEFAAGIADAIRRHGFQYELRLTVRFSEYSITNKVTTIIHLQDNEQTQLSLLNSNIRRKIRKCASNGVEVRSGKSELFNDFYAVYSRRMHQLGSPVLAAGWFRNLLRHYQNGEASVWCAYYGGKPVGAAFVLEYQGFYEACWFATLAEYNRLYVTYGLTWAMLGHAIRHTGKVFSLGRSTNGSSVHKYKQQWGGEDVFLFWNYSSSPGTSIRDFKFISKLWKLVPYPIALKIGPWFAGKIY